jgi:hypothetical protein
MVPKRSEGPKTRRTSITFRSSTHLHRHWTGSDDMLLHCRLCLMSRSSGRHQCDIRPPKGPSQPRVKRPVWKTGLRSHSTSYETLQRPPARPLPLHAARSRAAAPIHHTVITYSGVWCHKLHRSWAARYSSRSLSPFRPSNLRLGDAALMCGGRSDSRRCSARWGNTRSSLSHHRPRLAFSGSIALGCVHALRGFNTRNTGGPCGGLRWQSSVQRSFLWV